MQYFSEEYFAEVGKRLDSDPQWQQDMKGVKTSLLFKATDRGDAFALRVEDGKTAATKADGKPVDFSFEGSYETWTKVAKGEVDIQSAVLKGMLKFRGSIVDILSYKDRFARIHSVIRSIPVEY